LIDQQAGTHLCPPGGRPGQVALERTLRRLAIPFSRAAEVAPGHAAGALRAWIDPAACIGCTRCIEVCPVDAIAGAPKRHHAVVEAQCTGCDRCAPVCPVDCITMRPSELPWDEAARAQARQRHSVWLQRSKPVATQDPGESHPQAAPSLEAILSKARQRIASRAPQ
jgi:electron transport complex protein RnfB